VRLGATKDIEWLNQDEDGLKRIFLMLPDDGKRTVREIKEAYGSDEWWQVKGYLKLLSARGLVKENFEGSYELTDIGKKVAENLRALKYIPEVV